jgi:electron transfer flavoprotein beta subunit
VKVIVCVKRVPDTETRVRISDDGTSIDPAGVKFVLSPYDEFALEGALRTVEGVEGAEVVALSLGESSAGETLRGALAMGADRALLLKGQPTMDGLGTAKALADAVRADDASLVLLGVKAADDDQQQVGPMLASLLGRPCVTSVSSFTLEEGWAICRQEVEGGTRVVRVPLPAVLTITKGEFEPRYASLKGIMAAKRKPLEERDAQVPPSGLILEALELPPERAPGRIVGEGAEAAPELVRLLREEARVL